MFRQFAPMQVIPPSPKSTACTISAIDTATHAAHGPSSTAASTAPTAWPVVPPGIGTLNIMITKQNAALRASIGTCLARRDLFSLRDAAIQNGAAAAYAAAYVCGPR